MVVAITIEIAQRAENASPRWTCADIDSPVVYSPTVNVLEAPQEPMPSHLGLIIVEKSCLARPKLLIREVKVQEFRVAHLLDYTRNPTCWDNQPNQPDMSSKPISC